MTSPVQEIKERLDIVDFIRSYIPLQPAGKNFKALCPFHKEKTPSFIVSPERQIWHCFGACNEGGDIFKFLMKYENLEFYEVLKILAEKTGIELKKISPIEHKQFNILYEINCSAKDFFKKELERSREVLNYLKERGLKKETVEEFELGFSPAGFDVLTRYLINLGYDIKDIERAGLNYKSERGGYVDRFRNRIMFPLYNHFGKVVGFSGRIVSEIENRSIPPEIDKNVSLEGSAVNFSGVVLPAKYINSPETLIFNKSKILYGFHKTKENIRQQKSVILVEGQLDFLLVYQEGIKNVVATSGTALTTDHLKTLRRLTDQLILFFDNDEAGFNAAERAIDLATASDFNVRVLTFKDFKDPAEIVQKSPADLAVLVRGAKLAMEFYFERYLKEIPYFQSSISNFDLAGFKRNIRFVLAKIKNLASAVEQAYWLKEFSRRTKIEEKVLAEEMAQLKTIPNLQSPTISNSKTNQLINKSTNQLFSRRELISQRLISLINLREDLRSQLDNYLDYLPNDYLMILKGLAKEEELKEERLINLLNLVNLRSSFESSVLEEEKVEQEFEELLRQLRLEYLKEKRQELGYLLKKAEEDRDENKINFVLKEFNEVLKQINS